MGYNLLSLLIGSEGTLGIITRVTLALHPVPASIQTLVVPFARVNQAIESVSMIFDRGIIPFAVEFVEHSSVRCAERLLNRQWPTHEGSASLLVMLDGPTESSVMDQAERISEGMEENGALNILLAEVAIFDVQLLKAANFLKWRQSHIKDRALLNHDCDGSGHQQ